VFPGSTRIGRYPFPSVLVRTFPRGESEGWGSVSEHCHLQQHKYTIHNNLPNLKETLIFWLLYHSSGVYYTIGGTGGFDEILGKLYG